MKAWFQRFMSGRYGGDHLSNFLCLVALLLLLVGMFVPGVYLLGIALLIWSYFRIFSRNVQKRYAENLKYLQYKNKVTGWFSARKVRFSQRKTYCYFRCPNCHQEIRVPRGRGRISVTCPKCQTKFIKKS
jgi:uncharacterized paraquat-inducible protein A